MELYLGQSFERSKTSRIHSFPFIRRFSTSTACFWLKQKCLHKVPIGQGWQTNRTKTAVFAYKRVSRARPFSLLGWLSPFLLAYSLLGYVLLVLALDRARGDTQIIPHSDLSSMMDESANNTKWFYEQEKGEEEIKKMWPFQNYVPIQFVIIILTLVPC